jgi:hypothetical protein
LLVETRAKENLKKKSGEKNNIVMITHPLCKFNKFHENNIKEMVVYIIYILVW